MAESSAGFANRCTGCFDVINYWQVLYSPPPPTAQCSRTPRWMLSSSQPKSELDAVFTAFLDQHGDLVWPSDTLTQRL